MQVLFSWVWHVDRMEKHWWILIMCPATSKNYCSQTARKGKLVCIKIFLLCTPTLSLAASWSMQGYFLLRVIWVKVKLIQLLSLLISILILHLLQRWKHLLLESIQMFIIVFKRLLDRMCHDQKKPNLTTFGRGVHASNIPFHTIKNPHMLEFFHNLHPIYKVPSRIQFIGSLLNAKADNVKKNWCTYCASSSRVSLVFDGWGYSQSAPSTSW